MPRFLIINIATNQTVYEYTAENELSFTGLNDPALYRQEVITQPSAPLATVHGGRRILTKLEFRRLFSDATRPLVDEFNATYETHPALTAEYKRAIRSGLEDFKAATEIDLDNPSVAAMLAVYVTLGMMSYPEMQEVLNG